MRFSALHKVLKKQVIQHDNFFWCLGAGGGKGLVMVSDESLMEREAARKGGNPSFRSRRGTRSSRGSFQGSRKDISQRQLGNGQSQQLSQKHLDASTRGMADPAVSHPPSPLLFLNPHNKQGLLAFIAVRLDIHWR